MSNENQDAIKEIKKRFKGDDWKAERKKAKRALRRLKEQIG